MQRRLVFVLILLSLSLSSALGAQVRDRADGRSPDLVPLVAPADVVAAYNALEALEPGDRKALVSALTTEVRAGLRRLQHQMYLADHPELTAEQRSVLNGLIARLTAEMYMPPSLSTAQSTARAEMEQLHRRAVEIFSPEQVHEIFYRLGGERTAPRRWRLVPEAACVCATNDDCGGFTCVQRGCTIVPNNCGPDLAYACTGRCQ